MQAAVQRYIDSSISKTINVQADIPFERFKDIYAQAYALGCKGCTTYRPNEVTGSVLQAQPEARPNRARAPAEAGRTAAAAAPRRARPADVYEAGGVVYMTQPLTGPRPCRARPTRCAGRTASTRSTSP